MGTYSKIQIVLEKKNNNNNLQFMLPFKMMASFAFLVLRMKMFELLKNLFYHFSFK